MSPARRRFSTADVIAGVSVALVLVPQSLAYAELAGMPPERGLYASILPLLVAALLASSPYLQTGPVAVTALLTFGALSTMATPGSDEYVHLGLGLALVVGLVRLAIGLLRAGVVAYLLSHPMLTGFIPAAAILILASQLPGALGAAAEAPDGGVLHRALWSVVHPGAWDAAAVVLAAGALAVIAAGRRAHPLFPGVLVVVVAATAIAEIAGYGGDLVGEIPVGVPPLSLDLPWGDIGSLLVPGAVIALIGYAEPSSIARRFAAEDRERWDSNRELVSQGAANVAAAVSGGFPVGGSFSRSSLARMAGTRTRWSGAVTGVVVLACLPLAFLLEPLPKAVLGAIVIAAVVPLIRLAPIAGLWRPSKPGFVVAVGTFAATLAVEPHLEWAVVGGVAASIAIHLWRELRLDVETWADGRVVHVRIAGVLWFGVVQALDDQLTEVLAEHPDATRIVLHLDAIGRLDVTAATALHEIAGHVREAGIELELVAVHDRDRRLVDGVVEPGPHTRQDPRW